MAPLGRMALIGLAVVVVLSVPACREAPPLASFILVSLDTTRADHLGMYGYGRDATPFLDEVGRSAWVFEQAIAPSQNTLISHASLLTGLSPHTHGATPNEEGRAIAPGFTTLAEDLAEHGYQTAAFLAHADWLSVRFGFDQGFGAFTSKYRSAEEVLGQAERWWGARSLASPYFLFIHLFDVHSDWETRPYDAPEPFRGKFATGKLDVKGRRGSDYLGEVNRGTMEITPAELDVLRDQYDEGLAYVDHQLELFFETIPGETLERTWIFILADHGEGFMEHGKLLHSTLHDEVVRVPLLMVPPEGSHGARGMDVPARVGDQVRLIDVRPTVLSLAGLPPPTDVEGTDLVSCMRAGAECGARPAFLLSRNGDSGVRFEGFKLLREKGVTSLYDIQKDPAEQTELSGRPEMQERIRYLQTMLDDLVAQQAGMRRRILQGAESPAVEKDPEAEERLRSLGYVQ